VGKTFLTDPTIVSWINSREGYKKKFQGKGHLHLYRKIPTAFDKFILRMAAITFLSLVIDQILPRTGDFGLTQ
jgi:hypothetical protein